MFGIGGKIYWSLADNQVYSYDPVSRESVEFLELPGQEAEVGVFYTATSPALTPYLVLASEQQVSEAQVTDPSQ